MGKYYEIFYIKYISHIFCWDICFPNVTISSLITSQRNLNPASCNVISPSAVSTRDWLRVQLFSSSIMRVHLPIAESASLPPPKKTAQVGCMGTSSPRVHLSKAERLGAWVHQVQASTLEERGKVRCMNTPSVSIFPNRARKCKVHGHT